MQLDAPKTPLTSITVAKAKALDRTQRLFDGAGMYLEISPAGGKLWRLKYRLRGKEKRLALGKYPDVSLCQSARTTRRGAATVGRWHRSRRTQKSRQTCPGASGQNTFETIAREWHVKVASTQAETTHQKRLRFLEGDVFPFIGDRPIANLAAPICSPSYIESKIAVPSISHAGCTTYAGGYFAMPLARGSRAVT